MSEQKQSFFKRIGKDNAYVVCNTYYAYFAQGLAVIMLGSVLPALQSYYNISYQVSGMLLSVTFIGYAIFGLLSGYMPLYFGLKRSFLMIITALAVGMGLLLVSGNPICLLASMFIIGIDKGGVTTYNNQIVTVLSDGDAGPLNLLHVFFAIGACLAPIVVLFSSRVDATGWKLPVLISVIVAVIGIFLMLPMKLDNSIYERGNSSEKGGSGSLGFFTEKLFVISLIMAFLYQFVESSAMSWVTTYFIDSNVMTDTSAQLITSALWIALLAGRTSCSILAKRMATKNMLLLMTALQLVFTVMLVSSHTLITMMIATIGLGLGMSGMYGTIVSNAGDVFSRYPTSMGYYVLISSIGAVISPSLVGFIASAASLRAGFVLLCIAAAASLLMACYNSRMKRAN
ncbi:MAG: MFS transporter [Lachnospiraceae bacterium]|nr:MFS transporter [Lachnospiraceae bacterium]